MADAETVAIAQKLAAIVAEAGALPPLRYGTQKWLAPQTLAVNQCEACGVFREDGRPPTVHRSFCVEGRTGPDA